MSKITSSHLLWMSIRKKAICLFHFIYGKREKKNKKKEKAQMSYQQLNHKNPAVCQVCFPTLRTQMLAVSSRTDPTVLQTWLLQYTGFHIPEQICIYKKKILLF